MLSIFYDLMCHLLLSHVFSVLSKTFPIIASVFSVSHFRCSDLVKARDRPHSFSGGNGGDG